MKKPFIILAFVTAAASKKLFDANPGIDELHTTSDGEAFYKEGDAKFHARGLENKKVELITKSVAISEPEPDEEVQKPLPANEVINLVNAVENTDQLEPYRKDTRKSVIAAIEAKEAFLNKVPADETLVENGKTIAPEGTEPQDNKN